ncbi:MAG TPA: adenine deaminase [Ferruginibacter sp.]|nr:adenine deaminase [Ferruginibacter sp.]HMP20400.1 adenine deaminase [Ferruginibacter sp.]
MAQKIRGNIVDIPGKKIFYGELSVDEGKIIAVEEIAAKPLETAGFIMPGFVDSHVHIESSMLVPSEFARLAVVHGTVATISDPHEIANVCGMEGVEYMVANGKTVPFKFHFGAPSCVPATVFETAGATLTPADVDTLLQNPEINYLSEMMNFPGVLYNDAEVMQKIAAAKKYGKPVDGHAPGLRGADAKKYIEAGISTDHECFTAEEALDKLTFGMKVLIREGSAAKNFEALIGLLDEHYTNMMFCSDDKHPDSLLEGHINVLCARAVAKGVDVFKVLQAACINPVLHYNMRNGILRAGDAADFIVVENLIEFKVLQTYINGQLVAEKGKTLIEAAPAAVINHFNCAKKNTGDFKVHYKGEKEVPVIEALEGQLITNKLYAAPLVDGENILSNTSDDILKIAVVNRYKAAPVAVSFVKNFGLKTGAIASTVAHDSHNIIAVGADDESLCRAVNLVIEAGGGVSVVAGDTEKVLPLLVAGLMSNDDGYKVAADYTAIDTITKQQCGSRLAAPFMTLSFMALLVIPHLKLSDLGLFDGDRFSFIDAV